MNTISRRGFTVVELVIVVVVIAILAGLVVIGYNRVMQSSRESAIKSDLQTASTELELVKQRANVYPSPSLPSTIVAGKDYAFEYVSTGKAYCLGAVSTRADVSSYYVRENGTIIKGVCGPTIPIDNGAIMQTVTDMTCPTERRWVVDARDNKTYWIQKSSYGSNGYLPCWMLTNLAYAGGGVDTYGDVRTLNSGSGISTTLPYYYNPTGSNPTISPATPSTSTAGTGQYGYLYNWCGAMGNQQDTAACLGATTPELDPAVSVCPAGWRMPRAATGDNDFEVLNIINSNSTTSNLGLRNNWLAQYAGLWYSGYSNQATGGYYWSSSSTAASTALALRHSASVVQTNYSHLKGMASSVRCVINT